MAEQTTVLQLVLNQLQLENSISSINDRIIIQKVVCLVQEAGLQLGYSYNWYIRGPYSPGLTADYYQLSGNRATVESQAQKFVLTPAALTAVNKVRSLLDVPQDVALDRVYWTELLASVAFLSRRYRLGVGQVREKINSSKPLLAGSFDAAVRELNAAQIQLT